MAAQEHNQLREFNQTFRTDVSEKAYEAATLMPNFKLVDLDSSLIRTRNPRGRTITKLPLERQSPKDDSASVGEMTGLAKPKKIDWASYMPRLRKSLRGLHPKNLQGEIWPQKLSSITYNAIQSATAPISPITSEQQPEPKHKLIKKLELPSFKSKEEKDMAETSSQAKIVPPDFTSGGIQRVKPSVGGISGHSRTNRVILKTVSPLGQHTHRQSFFRLGDDIKHVVIKTGAGNDNAEMSKTTDTFPTNSKLETRSKRPIELTFVRASPPQSDLKGAKQQLGFPAAVRSNSYLSPQSNRVSNLKQALINLQVNSDTDETTGIVVSTCERPKMKVAAQTQYPFDFKPKETVQNSPFSQYMDRLGSPQSPKTQLTSRAYILNIKNLTQKHESKKIVGKQPTQLNIKPLVPQRHTAQVSPKNVPHINGQLVFSNLLDIGSQSTLNGNGNPEQLKFIVKPGLTIEMQGTNSKHTITAAKMDTLSGAISPSDKNSQIFPKYQGHLVKEKRERRGSVKDFNEKVLRGEKEKTLEKNQTQQQMSVNEDSFHQRKNSSGSQPYQDGESTSQKQAKMSLKKKQFSQNFQINELSEKEISTLPTAKAANDQKPNILLTRKSSQKMSQPTKIDFAANVDDAPTKLSEAQLQPLQAINTINELEGEQVCSPKAGKNRTRKVVKSRMISSDLADTISIQMESSVDQTDLQSQSQGTTTELVGPTHLIETRYSKFQPVKQGSFKFASSKGDIKQKRTSPIHAAQANALQKRQMQNMKSTDESNNDMDFLDMASSTRLSEFRRKYEPPQTALVQGDLSQNEGTAEDIEHHKSNNFVALESIYVRKQLNEKSDEEYITADKLMHNRYQKLTNRHLSESRTPIKTRELNLNSIPDFIRTEAFSGPQGAISGPKNHIRSISVQPRLEVLTSGMKSKRVEDIQTIVDRVTRANCCLKPRQPEDFSIMSKALGFDLKEGSFESSSASVTNAVRIKMKFLQNNFLQTASEDFSAIQNLERNVDSTIITTNSLFARYDLTESSEQLLMVRLFKRFYFKTVKQRYGYLKAITKDKVEISGRLLCSELELNPKVLPLCGIITTFGGDAMVSWLSFLQLMGLFLLKKDIVVLRLEFLLRFLCLTDKQAPQVLDNPWHIGERIVRMQFAKRSNNLVPDPALFVLWDQIRTILSQQSSLVFQNGNGSAKIQKAVAALVAGGLKAADTYFFFDMLFEIA